MTRLARLWSVAIALFALGVGLHTLAQRSEQAHHAARAELATMQLESNALGTRASAPIALETLAQRHDVAVQIEAVARRSKVRFEGAAANGVVAFLRDVERAGGQRVTRVSLAFVSPGVVSGYAEMDAR
jgi:hypothetical protein